MSTTKIINVGHLFLLYSISLMRFIDLVMMVLTALLSFALSVTISIGLNTTCSLNVIGKKENQYYYMALVCNIHCSVTRCGEGSYLEEGDKSKLEYYDEIHTAKVCRRRPQLVILLVFIGIIFICSQVPGPYCDHYLVLHHSDQLLLHKEAQKSQLASQYACLENSGQDLPTAV